MSAGRPQGRARCVAISGSLGGLGQAFASAFLQAGDQVLLLDLDEARLRVQQEALGAGVQVLVCDQTRASDVAAFEAAAAGVDVFINNAAITLRKPLEAFTFDDVQQLVNVNLTGAMAMAVAAGRAMLNRGEGVIVNVSSQLAYRASPGRATYGAAKAGLVHFTRTAAAEWIGRGVRVVGLAPGPTETPMVKALLEQEASAKALMAGMPIGRLLQPAEMAAMAVFLASPAAASIVGETLVADGGNLLS